MNKKQEMFKKKPSTQNNPYQSHPSNISQKLKTPISSFKHNKSNAIPQVNQYSANKKTPNYVDKSNNSGYQEEENNYIAEDSYRSDEESTLSYHQYKDIVSNLLENGDKDSEWIKLPETLKLIIKALCLSMNAIETKIIENREIINEQGLQAKDHYLQLDQIKKNIKKIKLANTNNIRFTQQPHTPNQGSSQAVKGQFNIYSKGLDMIMIEQVKTITDAIVSQKSSQIINQVNEFNFKIQQKIVQEIQQLKDKLIGDFVTKIQVQEMQLLANQDLIKMNNTLKERLKTVEEQIQHLNRQLISEKQAMCDFAQYVEDTFSPKKFLQEILKNHQPSQTKTKQIHQTDPISNPILSRNKIDQIVQIQIQSSHLLKRRDFQQFREKINAQITNFPTLSEVQAIVDKTTKTKLSKMQQIHQIYSPSHMDSEDQPTLQLKKSKYHSNQQNQHRQKSPKLDKKKNSTHKTSYSRLQLSKVSKRSKLTKRTSSNYDQQQFIEASPVSQHKQSRSKTFKESHVKQNQNESKQSYQKLLIKFEAKIISMVSTVKQSFQKKVEEETKSLEKRVIKRLQTAEQEFCSVVQENWKMMSEKNIKVQKAQKENMQHLLSIFSLQNVLARYKTIVNCKANECVKWDKEVFNAQSRNFYLNSEQTHLYVTGAGVYEVHVVFYTLYDPVISFGIELNSEEIYNSNGKSGKKGVEQQAESKKRHNRNELVMKGTHPSRGVEFFQTLLIPAKSHLVVRMIEEMNGQALIEIRKL